MRYQTRHEPSVIDSLPAGISVVFDSRVTDYILHELRNHPGVEEGGKYIGYVSMNSQSKQVQVRITDFLPGGPRARRTAVEFMPDGDFQEMLFRHAEQRDQLVEHVGTWHSHHCNGLRQLSQGDVRGYFKTLTKPAYRPPVFIASLVKEIPTNSSSRGWIDHFLFVKGEEDCFYKITDQIESVDDPSKFSDITGHEKRVPSIPDPTFWYETERGRLTLAEDQQQLRNISGLTTKATRRLGIISIRCQVGHKFMSVSYPERPTDQSVRIEVGVTRSLLSIDCSLADRQLGFAAGLHALERVGG